MKRRISRAPLAGAALLAALVALGAVLGSGRDQRPAPPEALARIAARNQDAAVAAAARMKAESEASARATDARLDEADAAAAR